VGGATVGGGHGRPDPLDGPLGVPEEPRQPALGPGELGGEQGKARGEQQQARPGKDQQRQPDHDHHGSGDRDGGASGATRDRVVDHAATSRPTSSPARHTGQDLGPVPACGAGDVDEVTGAAAEHGAGERRGC
jgi:hypothetical protein